MPDKKLDRLRKLAAQKNAFIDSQLTELEAIINEAAFTLSKSLFNDFLSKLSTIDGDLSTDNVNKVNLIERIWQTYQKTTGFKIVTAFVSDLQEIISLGEKYYTELIPSQVVSKDIEAIINKQLGIKLEGEAWTATPKGYIATLAEDRTIVTELKQIAYKDIISKNGYESLKTSLSNYLVGQGEDPGDFYKFHKQFAFDTYSEVDRLNSKLHADKLKLQYFLYNGGTVRDTRIFCEERHGKCFSTEEAEGWRDLIGKTRMVKGKTKMVAKPIGPIVEDKEAYNPIVQLGGFNCRHSADFVSEEIALELRNGK
jgi:hypothetical protein